MTILILRSQFIAVRFQVLFLILLSVGCLGLVAATLPAAENGTVKSGYSADDGTSEKSPVNKPNVIVIMTDEHNFRTLGCYRETMEKRQAYMWGPAVVETPNIDWIANNGALCTSYYATTPVCSPSRASLISGLYPHTTPVNTNNIPLNDGVVTFAEILSKQGYATSFAGKWHLDGTGKPQWAPKRKFGFEDNRFMFNRGHWKNFTLTAEGPKVGATKNGAPSYAIAGADEKSFSTDWLMDRMIEYIETNKANPFCYMLSLPDPHGPDTVRAPYDTMYDDQDYEKPTSYEVDERTVPKWGVPDRKSKFGQSKYYGMIKCIDDNVGRLVKTLKKEGILENTMIVFTSDHGDLRGEHHRQNKGVPWEGSARIPFLVYFPNKVEPKTRIDEALSSVDFTPTLMSMIDVETDQKFHGRDFSALLTKGADGKVDGWNDVAFCRGTGEKSGWLMAVSDRYKLVVSSNDQPWLFDLERDPDEMINMISSPGYREIGMKLGAELENYGKKFKDPRLESAKVKADLNWVARGKGSYEDSATAPEVGKKGKKRKKNGKRN